jgi:tRNA C32,U32 (ribose-2'-O)-methylase TrmJ
MMRALRKLLGRSQMDEREVRILQGIWSQMVQYSRIGQKVLRKEEQVKKIKK